MKRWTNLALFVLLGAAFTTGWVAFFYGTAPSRWSLMVHAASGFAIVALTPWKSAIAVHAIRRRRAGWLASLFFTALVVASVLAGLLHSSGLLLGVGPISAMELHVGAALIAIPFALWHVAARRIPLRRTDLSRRMLLRSGVVLASAAAGYAASEGIVRLTNLPGARRRFTGSYAVGSLQPDQLPVTQWMFDSVPVVSAGEWQLSIQLGGTMRRWTYDELFAFDDRVRATLDCTGGFYSEQDWSGVWLSRLLPAASGALSLLVHGTTGYSRRFPIEEASRLLLATRLGGTALDAGHGFPVRLVAPHRRGFWWVKWVAAIHLEAFPSWWQVPFPTQ
ncbi:MAG: molybdopterin-dependent oxidoreductase [Candidatus Dormibacteraeota bacterium]|nr:molybdopterin-dependent oxidoreductase [Candidatus Dormibacteraeota bacterium]